jgi:malonyl-CoA O-methyltransferase
VTLPLLQDWEAGAVATSFSNAAVRYDSVARLQRQVGSMLFNTLDNTLPDAQCVLDVGAGTGFCTELLANHNANVIAVDIAPAMLVQAQQRLGDKVDYVASNVQSLALQDGSVDLVFANLVLQWCVDLALVFREFKRVLKSDGRIVFSTLGPQTLWELRSAWQQVDGYRHVNDFIDVDTIQLQLKQAGLIGNLETHDIQMKYPTAIQLMRELKTLGAVNIRQSRRRGLTGKKRFQQVCDEYSKIMGGAEIHASWEVILGRIRPTQ